MSGPAEEKGGKSSKMPTLSAPALTMSASSWAAAGGAARTRASAKTMPGARARRRDNDFFMGPLREGEARERAAGTSFAGNAGAYNRRPGACPSPALRKRACPGEGRGRDPTRRVGRVRVVPAATPSPGSLSLATLFRGAGEGFLRRLL